jgi:hypothetical protein
LQAGGLLLPAAAIIPGFVSGRAFAATTFDFYISPTGSDSNPGTQSAPWAITALNTKRSLYAGRTVGLLDGTYNVYSLLSGYTDVDQFALDVEGGTSAAPTVIAAVNPQKAVITAMNGSAYHNKGGTPILGHSGRYTRRGYVQFDGLKISGAARLGIRIGIYGQGPQIPGIVVRNCEFTNFNGTSLSTGLNLEQVEFNQCTGYLLQNNYFHDNVGYSAGSADHFSAVLTWYCDRGVIEYNSAVNSGGFYGKEVGNFGTTIRYNYVDTSAMSIATCIQDFAGTMQDKGADSKIHNNVLIGAQAIVMIETLSDAGYIPTNVSIFNNTCVILNSAASRGIQIKTDTSMLSVYNNIVQDAATGDHTFIAFNVEGPVVVDYNYYHSTTSDPRWSSYSSKTSTSRNTVSALSLLRAVATLVGIESHSVASSSPMFVGSGVNADRYKLQSGSPCLNAGRVGGTSSGAATDLGAWGNGATAIGCNFNRVMPNSPVLSIG